MNNLSRITFGTWGLPEWKDYSQDYCKELFDFAYRNGIKSFDTALVYGGGRMEHFLSYLPKECFIATKIPAKNKSKEIIDAYDSLWIKKCIDQSRKRLKRDSLDLVQLHNWDYNWNNYQTLIDLMVNLKDTGLVKNWGISLPFESPNNHSEILDEPVINFFQVHYNILQQQNKDIIKNLKQKNKKVLLRSVLLHGFLMGSINPPFCKKYNLEKQNLKKERDRLFLGLNKREILKYCLNNAFLVGADSIVLGITKKEHITSLEEYL